MEPIYLASLISFIVGLLSYIIIRFWILPIGRYLRIKGHLASDIVAFLEILQAERPRNNESSQIQDQGVLVRRNSSELISIYQKKRATLRGLQVFNSPCQYTQTGACVATSR